MASRFEYHIIAEALEVVSVLDGKEHRIGGSGNWRFRLKGPLEPSDALHPSEMVIYREVVNGVMEFRVPPQLMATLLCGAKLTSVGEALDRGDEEAIADLRSGLAGHIEPGDEPRDALAFLAEAVWNGSWRTGPENGPGRPRTDTLLTRLRRAFARARWARIKDGLTNSRGEIDRLIARVPRATYAVPEPSTSQSGLHPMYKSASDDDGDECPSCGEETDDGDKFCSDCGADLAKAKSKRKRSA